MNAKTEKKNIMARIFRIKTVIPQIFRSKVENVQDASFTEQDESQFRAMEAAKSHAIASVRRAQWKV